MSYFVSEAAPVRCAAGIAVNTSIPCASVNYSYSIGRLVSFVVLHYTGNSSDKAVSNARYFSSGSRSASAHYFVDDEEIYQSVDLNCRAWAVGGTSNYKHGACRNSNSISIEMCCSGGYKVSAKTEANAAELCAALCRYIGIGAEDVDTYVIRHWDVWNKDCPAGWTGADNERWENFKRRVKALLSGEDYDMEKINELNVEIAELKAMIAAQGEKYDLIIDKMGEEIDALRGSVKTLTPQVFDYIDENMPEWARPTVQRLIGNDVIRGDEKGRLGLTYDMLRMLVMLDRAGLF